MNTKNITVIISFATAFCWLAFLFFFLCREEETFFTENQNTLTLGNWGHPQPLSCYETTPKINTFYAPLTSIHTCNACNLNCSTKEAMQRCQACLRMM
jgi:hypothetical protein